MAVVKHYTIASDAALYTKSDMMKAIAADKCSFSLNFKFQLT